MNAGVEELSTRYKLSTGLDIGERSDRHVISPESSKQMPGDKVEHAVRRSEGANSTDARPGCRRGSSIHVGAV
jgi:hypothetical protein